MNINEVKEIILLLGLAWNSYWDLRDREIHLLSVTTLSMAGILFQILEGFSIWGFLIGMLPGSILLGISMVTRGALGIGDGLVTLCIGFYLGVAATAATVLTALFLSAVWSGLSICFWKKRGKDSIAFVPFLLMGDIGRLLL